MEGLIQQAFAHVDMIGKEVHEGHFDLIGPDGEIILPQVWETSVQPDWMITMHMWPKPDPPKPKLPPLPPGVHHHQHHGGGGGGASLAAELQGLMMNGGSGARDKKRPAGAPKKSRIPGLGSFAMPRIPGLPPGIPPPGVPPPPPPPGAAGFEAAFGALGRAAAVPVKEKKSSSSSSGKKKSGSRSGKNPLLMFAAGAGRSGSRSRRERRG
jgi:hypothetical protein